MQPACPNRWVLAWFDWYCRHALRKHFHRLHLYAESPAAMAEWEAIGDGPPSPADAPGPRLYVANHVGFWDGIVLNHLLGRHARRSGRPLYCMIDARQIARHPFFRRVGGFSIDLTDARDGLRALEYAADLLRGGAGVVMFPQGAARPMEQTPLAFRQGAGWLAERVPGLRVVPVALRYEFWLDQRPEAMVGWGAARTYEQADRRQVTAELEQAVDAMRATLRTAGANHRPGERVLLEGHRAISEWKTWFRRR